MSKEIVAVNLSTEDDLEEFQTLHPTLAADLKNCGLPILTSLQEHMYVRLNPVSTRSTSFSPFSMIDLLVYLTEWYETWNHSCISENLASNFEGKSGKAGERAERLYFLVLANCQIRELVD